MPTQKQQRREQLTVARRALVRALALSDIPDGLHKEPALRDLLCRMGRHDFELKQQRVLECVYCGQQRGSTRLDLR